MKKFLSLLLTLTLALGLMVTNVKAEDVSDIIVLIDPEGTTVELTVLNQKNAFGDSAGNPSSGRFYLRSYDDKKCEVNESNMYCVLNSKPANDYFGYIDVTIANGCITSIKYNPDETGSTMGIKQIWMKGGKNDDGGHVNVFKFSQPFTSATFEDGAIYASKKDDGGFQNISHFGLVMGELTTPPAPAAVAGTIAIVKQVNDGEDDITDSEDFDFDGIFTFELKDSDGNSFDPAVIAAATFQEDGDFAGQLVAFIDLDGMEIGTNYQLHEIDIPSGYAFDSLTYDVQTVTGSDENQYIVFNIVEGDNGVIEIAAVNAKVAAPAVLGSLTVQKVFTEDVDSESLLEGFEFTLTSEVEGVGPFTAETDEDGVALFEDLPVGEYVLTESDAQGLFLVSITGDVTFDSENADWLVTIGEEALELSATATNGVAPEVLGSLTVQKAFTDKVAAGTSLEGFEFTLTSEVEGVGPFTAETDEYGVALFENLPIGEYVLTESDTLGLVLVNISGDGIVFDGEGLSAAFEISSEALEFYAAATNGPAPLIVTVGSISIQKAFDSTVDAGTSLEGFGFTISGPVTASADTNAAGVVTFSNLPFGVYTITESNTKGYNTVIFTGSGVTFDAGSLSASLAITTAAANASATVYNGLTVTPSDPDPDPQPQPQPQPQPEPEPQPGPGPGPEPEAIVETVETFELDVDETALGETTVSAPEEEEMIEEEMPFDKPIPKTGVDDTYKTAFTIILASLLGLFVLVVTKKRALIRK